jgi:hypothetical protein
MAPGSPPSQSNLQSFPQTTQKVAPSIDTTPSKTDGSDKYYGMENVIPLHMIRLISSLGILGIYSNICNTSNFV